MQTLISEVCNATEKLELEFRKKEKWSRFIKSILSALSASNWTSQKKCTQFDAISLNFFLGFVVLLHANATSLFGDLCITVLHHLKQYL